MALGTYIPCGDGCCQCRAGDLFRTGLNDARHDAKDRNKSVVRADNESRTICRERRITYAGCPLNFTDQIYVATIIL